MHRVVAAQLKGALLLIADSKRQPGEPRDGCRMQETRTRRWAMRKCGDRRGKEVKFDVNHGRPAKMAFSGFNRVFGTVDRLLGKLSRASGQSRRCGAREAARVANTGHRARAPKALLPAWGDTTPRRSHLDAAGPAAKGLWGP